MSDALLTSISRRRLVTAMALSPLLWQMGTARAATVDPHRVVALEWLPVELLMALGVQPYGVADIVNYRLWVNEPRLPESVIDVGLRTEPNLELLAQMKPSLLVWSTGYGPSERRYGLSRRGAASVLATVNSPSLKRVTRCWIWASCWASSKPRAIILIALMRIWRR